MDGWTDGRTDVRTDVRTDGISPLCSTGHRPLSGPLPKKRLPIFCDSKAESRNAFAINSRSMITLSMLSSSSIITTTKTTTKTTTTTTRMMTLPTALRGPISHLSYGIKCTWTSTQMHLHSGSHNPERSLKRTKPHARHRGRIVGLLALLLFPFAHLLAGHSSLYDYVNFHQTKI